MESITIDQVFMIVSLAFIIVTVVVLIMSSIPEFQYKNESNDTVVLPALEAADTACVIWFTFEYISRAISAPSFWDNFKSPISMIDLLAILPFYVELLFSLTGFDTSALEQLRRSLVLIRILRVLRVLRVLRILKVARYSRGFQSMGQTLLRSWRELVLLVLFMFTTNIMFSTAMYFIEEGDPNTMFHSIPGASWWCMITMTTVGYGDVYPVTVTGKMLACLTSLSGIILLAFPISVIVDNFNQEYVDKNEQQLSPDLDDDALIIDPSTGLRLNSENPLGSVNSVPSGSGFDPLSQGKIRAIDGKYYLELPALQPKPKTRVKAKFY